MLFLVLLIFFTILILIIVAIFTINNNSDPPEEPSPKNIPPVIPKPSTTNRVQRISRLNRKPEIKPPDVKPSSETIPKIIKQPDPDSDSESDDELNSIDEYESSSEENIKSPFIEQHDGFYPDSIFPDTQVIDLMSFSEFKIYLLDNSQIIISGHNRKLIDNNIKLNQIVNFRGFIYGRNRNQLFVLPNEMFNSQSWNWKLEKEFDVPKNINYINSTLDGKYLWIQNYNRGKLMDSDLKIIYQTDIEPYTTRVYGTNPEEYIIINHRDQTVTNPKTDEIFTEVKDAVINYEHRIILLKKDRPVNRIRILNWKPYYL